MADRFFGHALLALATKSVALCLRQDILPALVLHCASFYACHTIVRLLIELRKRLCQIPTSVLLGHLYAPGALVAHGLRPTSLGVEMILTRCTGYYLALTGDAKAL